MTFRQLSTGQLFEYSKIPGEFLMMIKAGERRALSLRDGSEELIHPNKGVNLLHSTQPGRYASDLAGNPMIVNPIGQDRYHCQHIITIDRATLTGEQVRIIEPEKTDSGREGYIILTRVEKSLKDAQTLLESAKVIINNDAS